MTFNSLMWLMIAGIIVLLLGAFISFSIMRKQQHREKDQPINGVTLKHPLLANPMILVYVAIVPVFILIVMIVNSYF